jgi:voltage-gated potassium channel
MTPPSISNLLLRRLVLAAVWVLVLFGVGTAGYYVLGLHFNQPVSLLDCVYMTLITLTTIGYGEIFPFAAEPGARLFTMALIVIGIGLFLYFISAATSFVVDGELQSYYRRRRMDRAISRLRGHIIVCGAGQTGLHAYEELRKTRNEVVLIERSHERFRRVAELVGEGLMILEGDATDDAILEEAGIRSARGLISCVYDDKDNLFCVITARTLNPQLRIIARAVEEKAAQKMIKAGADRVVSTHFIGAMRMVSEMVRPQVVEFLDIMLKDQKTIVRIEEVRIGKGSPVVGKPLREAELHRHGDLLVLAAFQPGTQLYRHNPGADFVLDAGMVLVILGAVEGITKLRQSINE